MINLLFRNLETQEKVALVMKSTWSNILSTIGILHSSFTNRKLY